jgi:hypothetical protein
MRGHAQLAAPSNGVASGTDPADHLNARVTIQPGAKGALGSFGKHARGPAGLDVNQDGAVDLPAAQGKVAYPSSTTCTGQGVGQGADQRQQRGAARRDGQPSGQPRAGPAAQGQRDRLQGLPRPQCAVRNGRSSQGSARQTSLWCTRSYGRRTGEPAGELTAPGRGRGVAQPPLVPAVHPAATALRTPRRKPAACEPARTRTDRQPRRLARPTGQPDDEQNVQNLKITRPK